ncbi:hypothetical protein V1527DRAFT_446908 [Lipomyces starkeyi]
MSFTPESLPDLRGRVYLVTGGNTGLGYQTVLQLAAHHAKVYLGSRSEAKGSAAIEEVKVKFPDADVHLLTLDNMNLRSVVSASQELFKKEKYLHGLVNNAGVMAIPFEKTVDGYESQFQTNYISHWLLTQLLMPLILAAASSSAPGVVRIVNISSSAHNRAPSAGIDLQDIDQNKGNPVSRYGSSKLANILHTKELDRRYRLPTTRVVNTSSTDGSVTEGEIWFASVHPGTVNTNLIPKATGTRVLAIISSIVTVLMKVLPISVSAEKGAYTQLFAIASDQFKREMSGAYLVPVAKVGTMTKQGKDDELAKALWKWTENEMKRAGYI